MGTWIVGGILALAVVFIIRYLIKQKKNGRSLQCGGDCSKCRGGH